jgi:hypothetical protein
MRECLCRLERTVIRVVCDLACSRENMPSRFQRRSGKPCRLSGNAPCRVGSCVGPPHLPPKSLHIVRHEGRSRCLRFLTRWRLHCQKQKAERYRRSRLFSFGLNSQIQLTLHSPPTFQGFSDRKVDFRTAAPHVSSTASALLKRHLLANSRP